MTTVVRDCDVIDTLESIRAGAYMDGSFISSEIFQMPDGDIVRASATATLRLQANMEDERNQAMQFYWTVGHFHLISDEGFIGMPAPAPLTVAQIREVFSQIVKHPRYTRQRITAFASDNTPVHIENGEVK